ncbi:MAG: ATP cone domain-containing protein, partial [Promethearchaeota archaeon]
MPNNSFSLIDLYPKYVINSKGEKKKFDENSIAKVLNKETGLDIHIAEKVAEDVIRKIIGLDVNEITTNYIRELVCVELTQRGLNKYRNLFARAINLENISFKLDEEFLNNYKSKQPDWGPLGYITYKRTYARIIEKESRKEEFWETIRRVVEGCYSIQKEHCIKLSLPWSDEKAQKSAQKMFNKIWNFKFIPPGRGLWMMGTEFIARHGSMSLNNCGFASTEDINLKYSKAFEFVMDALMLGVGVGFDTKGAGKIKVKTPQEGSFEFQIPDSREGWVESLKLMLEAYFLGKQVPIYNFNLIRHAGEPIRGFGGVASGPRPLKEMLEEIQKILHLRVGQKITSVDIVDIMNHIGKCVVAGNVRRSAEIALGDPADLDFVTCKQDDEALYSHRWASNNSVFAVKGLDYSFIANQIAVNGEPGIFWLENARNYG